MSRIRTIKPEFPQSESVGRLSRDARLLFIQLWTFVDDSGKSRAASRMLASHLFPYDDDARGLIDQWLDELEAIGFIRRYKADGSSYLKICNWLKHQKIDHPSPSRLPEFREEFASPRDVPSTLDLVPRTIERGSPSDSCRKQVSAKAQAKRFYDVYPRHVGPRASDQKFETIVKSGVDPEHIIRAAESFAEAHRRACTEKQFIPYPAVWLSRGGYDSEDLPQPRRYEGRSNGTGAFVRSVLQDIENDKRGCEESDSKTVPMLPFDGGRH